MPRDQWAKANSRAKYGAAPRPEVGGKKIKAFVVPARTSCEIRKSEGYWREYTTTRQSMFRAAKWGNQKVYVFQCGEWEIRVARRLVLRKDI